MTIINRYCNPGALDLILRSRDGEATPLAPLTEAERVHLAAWKRDHQRKHAITPTDFRIPVTEEDTP